MLSIVLIGTGNVAQQLHAAMSNNEEVKIIQVIGRDKKKLAPFNNSLKTATDYESIADADIYIIAVNDCTHFWLHATFGASNISKKRFFLSAANHKSGP